MSNIIPIHWRVRLLKHPTGALGHVSVSKTLGVIGCLAYISVREQVTLLLLAAKVKFSYPKTEIEQKWNQNNHKTLHAITLFSLVFASMIVLHRRLRSTYNEHVSRCAEAAHTPWLDEWYSCWAAGEMEGGQARFYKMSAVDGGLDREWWWPLGKLSPSPLSHVRLAWPPLPTWHFCGLQWLGCKGRVRCITIRLSVQTQANAKWFEVWVGVEILTLLPVWLRLYCTIVSVL